MFMHAAEIEIGIWPGVIAWRDHGFLKPGDGLVPFFLFDQVSPDIVVRVAELRVNFDCFQTLSDGAVVIAEKRIRPAAESVSLSRRKRRNGTSVEINGLLILALHLKLVGLVEVFSGGLAGFVGGHNA